MAHDDKEDLREKEAEAEARAKADPGVLSAAGGDSTSGEQSAAKHEAERAAAEEHVEAKQRLEEEVGALKVKEPGPATAHGDPHHHTAGDHTSHHYKPNRKQYMMVFVVLFVLTVLEVAVAQIPGISKTLLTIALVGLAVTKAAFVGLYYMHLKHETKILKLTVAIPLATPAFYALVLIADAAWRLTR